MYWYIELNGSILPTPYATMGEALEEIHNLKQRLRSCICDVVLK